MCVSIIRVAETIIAVLSSFTGAELNRQFIETPETERESEQQLAILEVCWGPACNRDLD